MSEAEIIALIEAQLALLFKKVRIPELTENTPPLSSSDRLALWNAALNKTRKVTLGDVATFIGLGGNTSTVPPNAADKGKYIFDVTAPQIAAGGDNRTIHLPEFAGKNFTLTIDGRDFKDAEYDVLDAGGFHINDPSYVLQSDPAQRVTLGFAEKLGAALGGTTGGGYILGIVEVSSNQTLTTSDLNKVIQLRGVASAITLTLPEGSGLPENSFFIIDSTVNNTKQHTITGQSGQLFYLNNTSKTSIYIGVGEAINIIYWGGDGWYILDAGFIEIYNKVGIPFPSWNTTVELNELYLDGSTVNRADYPRLWEKVQTLGTALVSDATWSTATLTTVSGQLVDNPYRGKFSTGDGSTTFRLPDFRNQSIRGLKAGTDDERAANTPGTFQKNYLQSHSHTLPIESGGAVNRQSLTTNSNSDEQLSALDTTGLTGGTETRMDNIGIYWKIKA